jgi:hypothetical protein
MRLTIAVALLALVGCAGRGCDPFTHAGNTKQACCNNLKVIEGGKEIWAKRYHKSTNDTPAWDDIISAVGISMPPTCPDGGVYTISPVGVPPTCSISEHTALYHKQTQRQ